MKISCLLVLFAAACAPAASSPQAEAASAAPVALTAQVTSPGAVRITLRNDSSGQVGYNLCSSTLQRRDGATWTAVPADEMCTMQLNTLDPGKSATFDKRLPQDAGAGEYRYVTSVESPLGTPMVEIASNPFRAG
jgi:hypothetical protein